MIEELKHIIVATSAKLTRYEARTEQYFTKQNVLNKPGKVV